MCSICVEAGMENDCVCLHPFGCRGACDETLFAGFSDCLVA